MDQPDLLNIQTLETISFERCKFWGEFLKSISPQNDDKEYLLDEIEKLYSYQKDVDIDDEEDSFEREEVLQDLTNRSRLLDRTQADATEVRNQQPHAKHQQALPLIPHTAEAISTEEDEDEDDGSFSNLLNQTKPLIAEHNRRWKEAGIDHILNTFDPLKIEDKVGGWIRRNHSVSMDTSISPRGSCTAPCCDVKRQAHFSDKKHIRAESETESLHSVDTARYILSSRKRHTTQQRVSSLSTTTTIKTFRLVQSKREELRKKYGYDDSGEEARRLNEIRRRRARAQHRQRQQHGSIAAAALTGPKLGLSPENRRIQHQYRQKQLRMRRSRGGNVSNLLSTDDDDDFNTDIESLKRSNSCQSVTKQRIISFRSPRFMSVYSSSFSSPSSPSYTSCQKTFKRKSINNQEEDLRPCKRESECRCWKRTKLCNDTKHLADTSTEDWVVDNCDTPKKSMPKKALKNHNDIEPEGNSIRPHLASSVGKEPQTPKHPNCKSSCSLLEEKGISQLERQKKKPKKLNKNSKNSSKAERSNSKIQPKSMIKSNKIAAKAQSESEDEEYLDDSDELRKAIKLSKIEYEKEVRRITALTQTETKAMNPQSMERKNKTSKLYLPDIRKLNEKPIKESSAKVASESFSAFDATVIAERSLKPQPKSVKLRKLSKMSILEPHNSQETTFFAHSKNICNSTALADDAAANRQFVATLTGHSKPNETGKELPQRAAGVKLKTPSGMAKTTVTLNENDTDCTFVSSTTDTRSLSQPRCDKGILLYTPDNKHLAPSHSLVDGRFRITEEHLSIVIGSKAARQFLKYYFGQRVFDVNSTVYFQPPVATTVTDSDSDPDVLECIGAYGNLYVSKGEPDQ